MKNFFPLTDYDFYAYLTSGAVLLAAADYTLCGSTLITQQSWTFVAIVFWTAVSYLIGHIISGVSSALVEHLAMRNLFTPPSEIQLGMIHPRQAENILKSLFANSEYKELPTKTIRLLMYKAAVALQCEEHDLTAEDILALAQMKCRQQEYARARLDQIRNIYGLCRNVCTSTFISAILLFGMMFADPTSKHAPMLFLGCSILCVGLFGRFVKFYSAFSLEVFRTFAVSMEVITHPDP